MVCLVTGSSRGLGKAIALAFAEKGHSVVIHYKEREDEARLVASLINDSFAIRADVRDVAQVREGVERVIERYGYIDILVNNAGVTKESLLLRTSLEDFEYIMDTNLKGAFNLIRAVSPYMIKKGKGHIINISSITGIKGREGLCAYSASKAGLIGLTLGVARELSGYNIMVNAVLPGYMMTEMATRSGDKARGIVLRDSLIKQFSNPDDVARFIVHLSGTHGITGQVFNLDSRII
ncbi:MAG: 3-oxoacyl-[acyl-carrier-protein] reductase [Thermodesulfovibrionia bacterium]